MTPQRYQKLSSQFGKQRIAIVGDFCLDRYLELDLSKEEISIETGLTVHNVLRVRAVTMEGDVVVFGSEAPDAPGLDLLATLIGVGHRTKQGQLDERVPLCCESSPSC